jgi:hypothetical protein
MIKKTILVFFLTIIFIQIFPQSVSIDSVRINQTIPRRIKLTELRNSGITIDSIVKSPVFVSDPDPATYVYIGASYFEYEPRDNNNCTIENIIFDNKIKSLSLGNKIVDNTTSCEDLKKMFPLDCSETKPIKVYGQKESFEMCSVSVIDSKGRLWDMKIIFFLQNNKLLRVNFWKPM